MGDFTLSGKTALVTGGSRGIGRSSAAALLEAGANVVITSRRQEAADRAAAELGGSAAGFAANATDEVAAKACVEWTLDRFGSLDILVNNAGTNPAWGAVLDQDHARFAKTFDVNLWAPLLWTGLAWTAWMREHGGAVINVSSVGGLYPGPNLGIYHAAKAGLIHATRHLALELAPNVRVNVVAPGVVRTRLAEALWKGNEDELSAVTPLGRLAEPEDIADVVVFLASDGSRWITGETIVIDGGTCLRSADFDPGKASEM
jgi:NAD(P)-dependent dehydrogenase (short-subunit alcohol dehydrogenase family)